MRTFEPSEASAPATAVQPLGGVIPHEAPAWLPTAATSTSPAVRPAGAPIVSAGTALALAVADERTLGAAGGVGGAGWQTPEPESVNVPPAAGRNCQS